MGDTRVDQFHGVRFYDSARTMGAIVAAFLGTGFIAHEPAMVIATPAHRRAISESLALSSFSIDALQQSGNLILLDASDTLRALIVHDRPDPVRFESVLSGGLARLHANPPALRAYDEMADILWSRGATDAAMRLESLWGGWMAAHRCSLVCGHAVPGVRSRGTAQAVCDQHSHILADNGIPHPLCRIRPVSA